MQALSGVTKDQRREYKSKFVDMDIEFQRMKERLETIHLILDDMQVCTISFCNLLPRCLSIEGKALPKVLTLIKSQFIPKKLSESW